MHAAARRAPAIGSADAAGRPDARRRRSTAGAPWRPISRRSSGSSVAELRALAGVGAGDTSRPRGIVVDADADAAPRARAARRERKAPAARARAAVAEVVRDVTRAAAGRSREDRSHARRGAEQPRRRSHEDSGNRLNLLVSCIAEAVGGLCETVRSRCHRRHRRRRPRAGGRAAPRESPEARSSAQGGAGAPRRRQRYQIGQMERVLEGAVEHGVTIMRDRLQALAQVPAGSARQRQRARARLPARGLRRLLRRRGAVVRDDAGRGACGRSIRTISGSRARCARSSPTSRRGRSRPRAGAQARSSCR